MKSIKQLLKIAHQIKYAFGEIKDFFDSFGDFYENFKEACFKREIPLNFETLIDSFSEFFQNTQPEETKKILQTNTEDFKEGLKTLYNSPTTYNSSLKELSFEKLWEIIEKILKEFSNLDIDLEFARAIGKKLSEGDQEEEHLWLAIIAPILKHFEKVSHENIIKTYFEKIFNDPIFTPFINTKLKDYLKAFIEEAYLPEGPFKKGIQNVIKELEKKDNI